MRTSVFNLLSCFLLLFFIINTVISAPQHKFKRYSTVDGLSQERIKCIIQDNDGFMWFGTNNGLNKFDGYEFINYFPEPDDSLTLLGYRIITLFEDSKHRLWIGTGFKGGLQLYDKKNDCFNQYLYYPDKDGYYYAVTSIDEDNKGQLWIATTRGLCRFNPKNPGDISWISTRNEKYKNFHDYLTCLYFDHIGGRLWIGSGKGLYLYNIESDSFTRIMLSDEEGNYLKKELITSINENSDGVLFIGTRGGLKLFDTKMLEATSPVSQILQSVKIVDDEYSVHKNGINNIYRDKNNTLWICSDNGLFNLIHKTDISDKTISLSFKYYNHTPRDDESLNYNFVKCAYVDNSNILWVGTNTGLNKSKNYKFEHFKQQGRDNDLLSNKIQAIYEDEDSMIWLGTAKGINLFHRKTNTFTSLLPEIDAVLSICEDKGGNMWFASWEKGIFKYNMQTKKHEIINDFTGISVLNNPLTNIIFADSKNNMWASVWGVGLFFIDHEKLKFTNNISSEKKLHIEVIFEDSYGQLWVGSHEGLFKFKRRTKNKTEYEMKLVDFPGAPNTNKNINCIFEDNSGYLWVGANTGLHKIHLTSDSYTFYNQKNGFISGEIKSIVGDKEGDFWMSTNKGITKFSPPEPESNINNKDPVFFKFKKEHGLQGMEFVKNSVCLCKSGEIFFGGTNGFNVFDPKQIKINMVKPEVVITDFLLFNKQVLPGDTIGKTILFKEPIHTVKKLILTHENNFFTFRFAALHFACPEQNQYAYILEGFDKDWNNIKNERKVSFIGLKPGKYVFKVNASNSDNIWADTPASIQVIILPPWWQTIWFRIFVVALLIISVGFILRVRTLSLKKQKQRLEETVEKRTHAMKEMNVELRERQEEIKQMASQLHDADQKQLRFFTNISHELRTPLTLILSPLELLLDSKQGNNRNKPGLEKYLKLMQRNAKRLLRLVDQTLDFRKLDQKVKQIQLSHNNIIGFVQEIVNAFGPMAETKKIHIEVKSEEHSSLTTHHSSLTTYFRFDPDIIEKILTNIISNAIKYTPEGGNVNIELRVKSKDLRVDEEISHNGNSSLITHHSSLIIKISDSGIGIKQENIDRIFDRFYRSEMGNSIVKEGSGIGLALTKELVELHHGKISVSSRYGKGTSFELTFPFLIQNENILNPSKLFPQAPDLNYTKSLIEVEQDIEKSKSVSIQGDKNVVVEPPSGEKETLLIIEDNLDMQLLLAHELSSGYIILTAQNGKEGLEKAIQTMPDFIVSDVMMPQMDGIELSKNLKTHENTCHIPLILLTAKAGEANIIEGLHTNADDYICKPFNMAILQAKIRSLLNNRHKLRQKFSVSLDIKPEEFTTTSMDEIFLQRAIDIVERNISNSEFTNDEFIKQLKYGRSMVYKKIKSLTDKSVSDFIHCIRIKKAAKLLLEKKYTVSEISVMVGYKYRESFYRNFSSQYGKTPSQFIKDNKKTE